MRPRSSVSAVLAVLIALAPAVANARAGGGASMGSRGSHTYSAPPATSTAPSTARPMERSMTQPTPEMARPASPSPSMAPRPAAAAQPSFFQRHPFMSGLMGGLIGAGIGGLLFSHGFGGAGLGFAGVIGLMLQLAIIGGLIWLVVAFLRRRFGGMRAPAAPSPYAYAGGPDDANNAYRSADEPRPALAGSGPSPRQAGEDMLGIGPEDFGTFERLLGDVQSAWSRSDLGALKRLVTPEMLSYFSEQLSANASRGVENHVDAPRLEQGDLAEAWRDGPMGQVEYATVAMRWSALDYTVDKGGRVVDGSKTERTEATEVWTFLRSRGGEWVLSAIQQT